MTNRARAALVVMVSALAWAPGPALAAMKLAELRGHLSVGYVKLLVTDAPGGNLSTSGGVDYPIAPDLRVGVDVGYHLLGSRTVERGSLVADVDFSVFEGLAMLHWAPPWPGPVGRISFGPGLFHTRADLSSSGGGASFSDLAVEETVPGMGLDVSLISRRAAPLRLGLEVGTRVALVEAETWTLAVLRLSVHY